ncbi:uncharacterized protein LOC143864114 isoform X4 [Tasmannia lanceolata]|uniref:uncharacterized protein LOC143864114 isoform X4 n=1 Tax=Tasmannia lanceolata TaxID=3420 RepID=UPI00406381D0
MNELYGCLVKVGLHLKERIFFTESNEVYDCFDSIGLQENLLRGIYAYGKSNALRNILEEIVTIYLMVPSKAKNLRTVVFESTSFEGEQVL